MTPWLSLVPSPPHPHARSWGDVFPARRRRWALLFSFVRWERFEPFVPVCGRARTVLDSFVSLLLFVILPLPPLFLVRWERLEPFVPACGWARTCVLILIVIWPFCLRFSCVESVLSPSCLPAGLRARRCITCYSCSAMFFRMQLLKYVTKSL